MSSASKKKPSQNRLWKAALEGAMGARSSRRDRAIHQEQLIAYAKENDDVDLIRLIEAETIAKKAKEMYGDEYYSKYKEKIESDAQANQELQSRPLSSVSAA